MGRSHPPTLITLARRTLREECAVDRGAHLLVAVSGGGDSLALLSVLAQLRDRLGLTVTAHGVDHGLRPEAGAELDLGRALASELGLEFAVSRVTVTPGGNLQERAREARFAVLRRVAAEVGATCIATAHHADDRAETVLLRLARGAGPRGLAVLPPRDGDLVRPLIRARRADIQGHLARHGIVFARDPSNLDRRYGRVRVRLDILPALVALSPNVVDHLCALADALGDAAPSVILLADGQPIELGRAQQSQIRRALAVGGGVSRVRLPSGRDFLVERGIARVIPSAPRARPESARGDAKRLNRG